MKSLSVTIQMKATEQDFPVVLFIMLYEMVLTFESECNHSNKSCTVLNGNVTMRVQPNREAESENTRVQTELSLFQNNERVKNNEPLNLHPWASPTALTEVYSPLFWFVPVP